MLPGKIPHLFNADGFQVDNLCFIQPPLDRLDRALFHAHEKHIGQGRDHMEVFSEGQQAQKGEKYQLMDKIGSQVDVLQPFNRCFCEQSCNNPVQGPGDEQLRGKALVQLRSRLTALEQGVKNHEPGDQPQDQDGLSGMRFTVFFRDRVAFGAKDAPSNHGTHNGDQDKCGANGI